VCVSLLLYRLFLKKERFKVLFVSRFSPEVTDDDVEKSEGAIKPKEVGLHQT
jgi:hypothetical protein